MEEITEIVKSLQDDSFDFKISKREKNIDCTHILSIVQKSKSKYYMGYLKFYKNTKNIYYKDLYLRVDKIFFLEIANITIDDEYRFHLLKTILGKRQFSLSDNEINCYLIDYSININWLKELKKGQLGKLKEDKSKYFYHKGDGKNINFYEIFFLEKNGIYYTLLIQNNVAYSRLEVKEFIVQLSKQDFEKITNLSSKDEKVNTIFEKIGDNYINSHEFKELKNNNLDIKKQILNHTIKNENLSKNLQVTFKDSELKDKQELLNSSFSKLNKISIKILKEPFDIKNINTLALYLKEYSEILSIDINISNLEEVIAKLSENIFLSKNLQEIFKNKNAIENIVEMVELIEECQDSILNSKYDFMINFMIGDLIEKIEYINSKFE